MKPNAKKSFTPQSPQLVKPQSPPLEKTLSPQLEKTTSPLTSLKTSPQLENQNTKTNDSLLSPLLSPLSSPTNEPPITTNAYQERKERRLRNAEYQEQKNRKISNDNSLSNVSGEKNTGIPMGQPILIGHHSERRHRNVLKQVDNKIRKGIEAHDKANYYADKQDAIINRSAIDSDDPEAVTKLKQKIENLKESDKEAKELNSIMRKYKTCSNLFKSFDGKSPIEISSTMKKIISHVAQSKRCFNIDRINCHYFGTNSAEIRRLKSRLEFLEEKKDELNFNFTINDIKVFEDDGRIKIEFGYKPSKEDRAKIKGYGMAFKWSPYNECWQRKITQNTGKYFLTNLRKVLDTIKE